MLWPALWKVHPPLRAVTITRRRVAAVAALAARQGCPALPLPPIEAPKHSGFVLPES